MLEVSDLDVAYADTLVLRGVSLSVGAGQAIGVLGANGAGKSTLVKAISGTVRPQSGQIVFEGARIDGEVPEEIVRNGIAVVPEGRRIWSSLTVDENMRLGATAFRGDAKRHTDRILDRFPVLREYSGRTAGLLSGGQQQQLAIARALAAGPTLLLLDEPSLGLAPAIIDSVFDVLTELRAEGLAMLLVEQHTTRALAFTDYSYVLRGGKIVMAGASGDMAGSSELAAAYLGD